MKRLLPRNNFTRGCIASAHPIRRWALATCLAAAAACSGCGQKNDLVLYSAGDKMFSETVINEFQSATGVTVVIASDTELTRGIGLRTRIMKEKDNPKADVYWNNELANTILLKQDGALAQYKSPSAEDIPAEFKDPEGYWTAFGARARIFLVNTDLVLESETPRSMNDIADPKWKGKFGMSAVTGGTTATHAAALFELMGEAEARKFYAAVKANGVVLCNGNGNVKDRVADGELAFGWTDTNDANIAIKQGKHVKVVYPDQGEGEIGTFLIPHSVSLVAGAPNADNARKFIDFLLRRQTEEKLAASASAQVPVRSGVAVPREAAMHFIMDIKLIKNFNQKVDFAKVAARLPGVIEYMEKEFNK